MQEPTAAVRPGEHPLTVPAGEDDQTAIQSLDDATTVEAAPPARARPGPGADEATLLKPSAPLDSTQVGDPTAVQAPPALARAQRRPAPREPAPPPAAPPTPKRTLRRRTTQMVKAAKPIYPVLLGIIALVFLLQLVFGYLRWLREDEAPAEAKKNEPGMLRQILPGQ